LATKELAVALQHTVSHFLFTWEFLTQKNMTVIPHPSYFSVFLIEDKIERPPF
jgi:hypothetical protein